MAVYHFDSDRNLVKRPVAVVSESSDHSRIAALTCIDFVIKVVEKLCAYCMKKYLEENEAEDWLICPMCHQWFHEKYFVMYSSHYVI